MNKIALTLFILLIFQPLPLFATDWDDCSSELDRLRRASRNAADEAEEAESAKNEYESKKDELESCLNYPDIYDLLDDNCESIRWDYDSALSNYQSEVSDLESELDTVGRRIRSVQSSCDYTFSLSYGSASSTKKGDSKCELYKQYKNKLPLETLLETCRTSMSIENCKKCLGVK